MPRKVDHEQRRAQIAAALMRVAARDGLEGISLRHVGAEAGVTSGMVQHYFPTKDAMMHYAMDAASAFFAGLGDAPELDALDDENPEHPDDAPTATEPAPPASAGEQIFTLLRFLLPMDEQRREAGLVTLAFTAYAATNEVAAGKLAWGNAQLREYIAGLLAHAGHEGQLAPGVDPHKAAAAVLATTEGLGLHCLTGGLDPDVAAAALEHQISLLFAPDPQA